MLDGQWDRAGWCELLAPDSVTLMDRDEDRMLAQEQRLEQRLRSRGAGNHQQSDKGHGKGKDKDKGKDKGKKWDRHERGGPAGG